MLDTQYRQIKENIQRIKNDIAEAAVKYGRDPNEIQLMAVTKTVPAEVVNIAIKENITLLGENRAQELCSKYDLYDKANISIHFIGGLQTNKVNKIIGLVDMIHSVNSPRLAQEIGKQAKKINKTIDILMEINVAEEESKLGLSLSDTFALAEEISSLSNLRLRGLMTIPPADADERMTERYFSQTAQLKDDLNNRNIQNVHMDVLSMGMSGDFPLAIKHGATIVRVGSALFGKR